MLTARTMTSRCRVALGQQALRALSSTSTPKPPRKSLVTGEEGVHQTMKISKSWRNKPLFRRQGDVRFKTGMEASDLLVREALRRDAHLKEFIDSITSVMQCLAPVFDRNPKYAFVAKTLMEPERFLQFRVAWIDDTGVIRMNRGYRIQYSSSLGPYHGGLHFGYHINNSVIKGMAFDQVFSNALTGFEMGAAVGGSDFNPIDKSEGELQRFCQSYMTELSKYIGPEQDFPWGGTGVGKEEMGYLFGQYKRIKTSPPGKLFLSAAVNDVSKTKQLRSAAFSEFWFWLKCPHRQLDLVCRLDKHRPLDLVSHTLRMKCSRTRATPWQESAASLWVVADWLVRWPKN